MSRLLSTPAGRDPSRVCTHITYRLVKNSVNNIYRSFYGLPNNNYGKVRVRFFCVFF